MSVQAGIWNFDRKPGDRDFTARLRTVVASYGPDGEGVHLDDSMVMLYRPFHTTLESRLERQPHISSRGLVITWDGRLDNREDLIPLLNKELGSDRTDLAIVSAAF